LVLMSACSWALVACSDASHEDANVSITESTLDANVKALATRINNKNHEAINELKSLADSGSISAQKYLGYLTLQGKRVKKDIPKGLSLLAEAADAGDRDSRRILGKIYSNKNSKYFNLELSEKYSENGKSNQKIIRDSGIDSSDIQLKIADKKWPNFDINNEIKTKATRLSFGSAVSIGPNGVFLTNRHVVEGCKEAIVRYNGMFAPSVSTSISNNTDLAILRVERETPAHLIFVKKIAVLGEKVYVGGFPLIDSLGGQMKITDGIISGMDMQLRSYLQMSASISSGNSGGPVVDESGRIVGIATLMMKSGEFREGVVSGYGINFAIHSDAAKKFLTESSVTVIEKDHGTAKNSKEIAEMLRLSTALVICI